MNYIGFCADESEINLYICRCNRKTTGINNNLRRLLLMKLLLYISTLLLIMASCGNRSDSSMAMTELSVDSSLLPSEGIDYIDSLESADHRLKIYQWRYSDESTTPFRGHISVYRNKQGEVVTDKRDLFFTALGDDWLIAANVMNIFTSINGNDTTYLLLVDTKQSSTMGNTVVLAYTIGTDSLQTADIFRCDGETYPYLICDTRKEGQQDSIPN